MKKNNLPLTQITIIIILLLVVANIYLFVRGMYLGDDISRFETKTQQLQQENIELEKKVLAAESLEHAASVAATLGFTSKSQPYSLESLKYAFNR
ncbi:hypothetical protein M1523_04305 [Patescibacteria group bacterium]|nr:hypothetical protein [Patescibacteria group bacterium]MCL5091762.1 hypothetical protein [Patescibacteria group bacterium]